jgi:hypothetical protein
MNSVTGTVLAPAPAVIRFIIWSPDKGVYLGDCWSKSEAAKTYDSAPTFTKKEGDQKITEMVLEERTLMADLYQCMPDTLNDRATEEQIVNQTGLPRWKS